MKRLSLYVEFVLAVAVFRVANQRVADICHMHADLVRAPREQAAFDKSAVFEPFQYVKNGRRRFAAGGYDCHFFAVDGMSADIGLDNAFFLRDIAVHERDIFLNSRLTADLFGKAVVRKVIFGDDHDAGSVLVKAVDDAGTYFAVYAGQFIAAVI